MLKIKIGSREIPLYFSMEAFAQVEEEVGLMVDLNDLLNGEKRIRNLVKMIRILGNEGLKAEEPGADGIDDAWLTENMKPGMLSIYQIAIIDAVGEGLKMETDDPDKEVDVTLREIRKKKEKDC